MPRGRAHALWDHRGSEGILRMGQDDTMVATRHCLQQVRVIKLGQIYLWQRNCVGNYFRKRSDQRLQSLTDGLYDALGRFHTRAQ